MDEIIEKARVLVLDSIFMKYILLAITLLVTSFSFSQVYRAGESSASVEFLRWEMAVGWTASTGEVALKNGATSLDGQQGFYGRVLYFPLQKWAFGIEGTVFSSEAIAPIVRKYSAKRLGLLAQYRLTPDTNPQVYLLAGIGATLHKFNFVAPYRDDKDIHGVTYGMIGAGLEVTCWKNFFGAAEVRAVYNTRKDLNLFYHLSKRWEAEGKLLIGVRF